MDKRIVIVIVIAVLAIGGFALRNKETPARITHVAGDVTIASADGTTRPAEVGEMVAVGETIQTAAGAEIDVLLKEECAMRLEENGEAAIASLHQNRYTDDYQIAIDLQEGTLLNRVDGLAEGSDYNVQTTSAVCGVRGTRFGVTASGEETEVGVLEGSVVIEFGDGQTKTLTRDQIVSIYRSRGPSNVKDLSERTRQRLRPCGYLNFQDVVEATKAMVNIYEAGNIQRSIEMWAAENGGTMPATLEEMYGRTPNDRFGHPYIYTVSGNSYTLASMGEDGIPGTGDDVIFK